MTTNASPIHLARASSNGLIIFHFTEAAPSSGVWVAAWDATMTKAQLATMRAGEMYFNAHSVAFPGGEVRCQISTFTP